MLAVAVLLAGHVLCGNNAVLHVSALRLCHLSAVLLVCSVPRPLLPRDDRPH